MTQSRFLDANIFVRHITGDHETHSPAARALFDDIELGRATAWTTDLTIAEAVYVLASKRTYHLDRPSVRAGLLPLINLPGLELPSKALYPRAFDLYVAHPIDFHDAFHAALIESRGETELYSFDQDFDRIPSLTRFEPPLPSVAADNAGI
ncbi:MAG TPA: type II toxin-antitoxin system VapC family toxin [Thermomicrobiales bacterium]|nr:type II toxin-antitoxin system VapC family toxin [Thermomicrobiales bacterium]